MDVYFALNFAYDAYMSLTALHKKLKTLYSYNAEQIEIEDSSVVIRNYRFHSDYVQQIGQCADAAMAARFEAVAQADSLIVENTDFVFPIVFPEANRSYSSAILVFHGINERSWKKYLPWAYTLAERAQEPVILFPMAYHVNRGLRRWATPQAMQAQLERRQDLPNQDCSTFANVAISQRIDEAPMRFLSTAMQSAYDIEQLARRIKAGQIAGLQPDARVDMFAYSIGAILAQALLIANTDGLFEQSKLFLFCGGSHFSSMRGCTRLIMDKVAYTTLQSFFLDEFFRMAQERSPFGAYFRENALGRGFWTMLAPRCDASLFNKQMMRLGAGLQIVTLRDDTVIPSASIKEAFADVCEQTDAELREYHFDFEYRHEMPFPILNDASSVLVDAAFDEVFDEAAAFFRR